MENNTFKYINLEYLDLMSAGDDEMKNTVLKMLLEEIPEQIEEMKEHLLVKNWKELNKISHKLKTSFPFIGYAKLTEANKEMEKYSKAETDLEKIPNLLTEVELHFNKTIDEIKSTISILES